MIEDRLAEFGILGLWTSSLLVERYIFQKNLGRDLRALTEAIRNKI